MLPGEGFFVRAFFALSTCRGVGMAVGPIPWLAVVEYADRARLGPDMARLFEGVMCELDDEYGKWMQGQSKRVQRRLRDQPGRVPSDGRRRMPLRDWDGGG